MFASTLQDGVQPSNVSAQGDNQDSSGTVSIPERLRQWSSHQDTLRKLSNGNIPHAASDESDAEVDPEVVGVDDISGLSTLGVSISKRQSRLASFDTPAAERAAALRAAGVDDGVTVYDGVNESAAVAGGQEQGTSPQQRNLRFSVSGRRRGTSATREASRYPKYYDSPTSSFLSNVGALLGFRRTSSPDLPARHGLDEEHKGLLRLPLRPLSRKRAGSVTEERDRSKSRKSSILRRASIGPLRSQQPASEQNDEHFVPKPLIRRTTSESALHRPLSATPSLGDDTRFQHIHEMMNSRSRAIKDSFVDANIRFPAIRDFTGFSFPSPFGDYFHNQPNPQGIAPPLPNRAPAAASLSPTLREKEAVVQPRAMNKVSPVTHPHFANALEKLTGDIVIMGGYRGSVLRSAKAPYRKYCTAFTGTVL